MSKYKIVYLCNGNKQVCECEAETAEQARYSFEMCVSSDEIISIEEVTENV